jgi:hypothetical protein
MKTFTKLAKEGKIGRLCQRGAWVVAALGTLQILLQLYSAWGMYQQLQLSQPGSPYSDVSFFLSNVSFTFGSVINIIFSFLVLYAAGTIINTIFLHENSDITFEPLKEEEVAQRNDQR